MMISFEHKHNPIFLKLITLLMIGRFQILTLLILLLDLGSSSLNDPNSVLLFTHYEGNWRKVFKRESVSS